MWFPVAENFRRSFTPFQLSPPFLKFLPTPLIAIANLLMGVLTMVAGQAPGDEQELCTVSLPALGRNIVEDPPNGRILITIAGCSHQTLIQCGR